MSEIPKQNLIGSIDVILSTTEKRPFDMYLLGPFLIWYAMKFKKTGKWPRRLLLTAGIYQLFYNWKNYKEAYTALESPEKLKKKISEIYSKYEVV